jgi:fructose-1,6-bisphosphatase/inositol monophosphatase family enzyme
LSTLQSCPERPAGWAWPTRPCQYRAVPSVPHDLTDAVAGLVREVSARYAEPRFRALGPGESHLKAPGEVVTVADLDVEAALERELPRVVAAPVVGEEGSNADPSVLDFLGAPQAWVVDPVDGTANFAAGRTDWAVMVALLEAGETQASWIWLPVAGAMYTARRGHGAQRNGVPLRRAPAPTEPGRLRGSVLSRFMTGEEKRFVAANQARLGDVGPGRYCAGAEYATLVDGGQDFALFRRVLPWDHAPGSLIASEAGCAVRHPDGSGYRPGTPGTALLAAADERCWQAVREALWAEGEHA